MLLRTGTFGLALATGGQGTGAATAVNEMGCLAGVEASDQAAVELQVSFVLLLRLYSAHRCAVGCCLVRTDELLGSALADRIRWINGDAKLTLRFWTQEFWNQIKSNCLIDREYVFPLWGLCI